MKKAYEVTYKDGNKFKTAKIKGYTLIGALVTWTHYLDVYDNLVAVDEICFERYNKHGVARECILLRTVNNNGRD